MRGSAIIAAGLVALGVGVAAPAAPCVAAPSGEYRCTGKGDAPTARIAFSETGYRFTAVTADWDRDPEGTHGTGGYDFGEGRILPLDGPLAFVFGVVGRLSEDGDAIRWHGGDGTLRRCGR